MKIIPLTKTFVLSNSTLNFPFLNFLFLSSKTLGYALCSKSNSRFAISAFPLTDVLSRFPFLSNSRSILLVAVVENDNFSIFLVMSSKAAIFKFLNSFNELNFPVKFRSRDAL